MKPKDELSLEQLIQMRDKVTFPNEHNEWLIYDIHVEEGDSVYYYTFDNNADPPVYRFKHEVKE